MAIVKYGTIVTELKGKFAGSVFQKCGNQLSLRANPSRISSQSNRALKTRNNMRALASAWASLSYSDKASYASAASSYPTLDKFGNPQVLQAYQLFVYINRVMQLVEASPVSSASAYYNILNSVVSNDDFSISAGQCLLTLSAISGSNIMVIIYASQPSKSVQVAFSSARRFCGFSPAANGPSFDIYQILMDNFDLPPVVGDSFFIEIAMIDTDTGVWQTKWVNKLEVLA